MAASSAFKSKKKETGLGIKLESPRCRAARGVCLLGHADHLSPSLPPLCFWLTILKPRHSDQLSLSTPAFSCLSRALSITHKNSVN